MADQEHREDRELLQEMGQVEHILDHRIFAAACPLRIPVAAQVGCDDIIVARSRMTRFELRAWSRPPWTSIISGFSGLPQLT